MQDRTSRDTSARQGWIYGEQYRPGMTSGLYGDEHADSTNTPWPYGQAQIRCQCWGAFSEGALGPVDIITKTAQGIGGQNLSRRLSVPQTGDELQRLTETLNGMLDRLEGVFKRITQFTADA